MRLHLAGSLDSLPPKILSYTSNQSFNPLPHIDEGYNNFEVLCIGAAGGRGAGNSAIPGGGVAYGGAGGGGGVHRKTGKLSFLPISCAVVVGVAGANGGSPEAASGGHSSFAAGFCRASGGKGGKAVVLTGLTDGSGYGYYGDGGAGGVGDSTTPGGGASGGQQRPTTSLTGQNGSWDNTIGQGGGGGGFFASATEEGEIGIGTIGSGGKGAYSASDPNTAGTVSSGLLAIPGSGGGATTYRLTGSTQQYGSNTSGANPNGIVVLKLTR